MRIETAFSAFAAAFLLVPGALAADWQKVAAAGNEQVDIDKTRIMRTSPGQTVAWTRLTLGRELKDAGGSYTAVQAMNRYDCNSGRFVTLRRVYMKGELAVREEQITSPKEVFVAANSLDERLMNEACKLRTVGEAHQTAAAAAAAAAAVAAAGAAQAQEGKPGVMYADVRALAEEPKVHAVPVADTAALDAGEEGRPKSAADTKIEIRSPSERPRFIGLPKMEKPPTPEESKAAEGKVAEPAPTAKAPSNDDPIPIANVSRQERERLLATSGPRRATARPAKREGDPAPAYRRDVRWGYEGEGAPANWARLRPEYGTCSTGKRQSPIDVRDGIKVDLEPIQFNYGHSYVRIADTGSTIQVNVGEGSSITVTGRTYQLQQFHFTRPSEERINGKAYEMSLHLVHRDSDGRVAIIAILLDRGQENPLIQTLWNNMPLEVNQDVVPSEAIDLKSLLPDNRAYYTYMGSLTTPPCTEDVLWMVLKQPIAISADQVAIFSRLYRNNARPIQPSNNRLIKENR